MCDIAFNCDALSGGWVRRVNFKCFLWQKNKYNSITMPPILCYLYFCFQCCFNYSGTWIKYIFSLLYFGLLFLTLTLWQYVGYLNMLPEWLTLQFVFWAVSVGNSQKRPNSFWVFFKNLYRKVEYIAFAWPCIPDPWEALWAGLQDARSWAPLTQLWPGGWLMDSLWGISANKPHGWFRGSPPQDILAMLQAVRWWNLMQGLQGLHFAPWRFFFHLSSSSNMHMFQSICCCVVTADPLLPKGFS